MPETDFILMSLLVFLPAVFALVLLFFPRGWEEAMRWWALFGTAATLGLSLCVFVLYQQQVNDTHLSDPSQTVLAKRAEEADRQSASNGAPDSRDWLARYPWIPHFNIDYYLGLDGISLALVLLTTLISFLAMVASWKIDRYVRGYLILFLVLETGMLGTFLALDFFLFYIFWEVMLLPMYFLIGVWGGPRREYAAIKFFLYTLLGSVFILIAILGFYFTDVRDVHPGSTAAYDNPKHTFDLVVLQRAGQEAGKILKGDKDSLLATAEKKLDEAQKAGDEKEIKFNRERIERLHQPFFSSPAFVITMFVLLFIGFAIKIPIVPLHTWLPDAHVEAPTPISMILAGVLLKMGGYGLLRIAYPICPYAAEYLAWWVSLIGIVSIVYGALAAMAQTDFKKLVAYSSVSHMGYVVLGIAAWQAADGWKWGMNGAMFQMIGHGISSAGMFFLVGVIYDRAHHRNLDNFRGLYEPMPLYTGISAVIFFAAMGLPGLCGFIGEVFVVLATWQFSPVFSLLAAATVVLTAGYILWTVQRVFLGTNPAYKNYPDIDLRELACAVPLVVLAVVLGIAPQTLVLSWMQPSVDGLVQTLSSLGH
jgi:NADH-quinone oxidoreductase subunit M